jgi:FtsZ-binding cell division protein ZapB
MGELEARVRETERCQDRLDGRLGRVEEDMRLFRPMPLENEKVRATVEALAKDIHEAFEGIRDLRMDFESDRKERQVHREAREEKERERERQEQRDREVREQTERRDRWARWVGAGALTLTFLSMTVGWLILAL